MQAFISQPSAVFKNFNSLSFLSQDNKAININKVQILYQQIKPLTLPFIDLQGRSIQIWKIDSNHLVGTIVDAQGKLTIIPGRRIYNSLNSNDTEQSLISHLQSLSLRKWDLALDVQRLSLTIWPHLEAAGRYNQKKISAAEAIKDMNQRLSNLEKGALNPRHYTAYQIEAKKQVLKRPDGTPVTKKDGTLFDHIEEVRGYQQGTIKLIQDVKEMLGRDDLTPEQRKEIESFLSNASKVLDESKVLTKQPYIKLATQQFHENLQKTGLIESYNSCHQDNPAPTKGNTIGEIGGIGCNAEFIEGLFATPESLFEDEHLFYLPLLGDDIPFSDEELRQLMRELAIGIYVHNTVPFFSLHFNQNGDLYPVIHPVYEKTLVGQVISMLDYIMKGYLNGGVFNESFVQEWYKNPDWQEKFKSGLQELINFKDYCVQHIREGEQHYLSLRDLTFNAPLSNQSDPSILKDYTQFSNSFRIIAKQKSIQKADSLFVIDWDFDVKYTIDPNAEYQEALQQFCKAHGKMPLTYEKMVENYELMSKWIHAHMIKLPLCRKYFSMLGLISFFSSYFMTLKKYGKIPYLPTLHSNKNYGSPPLFPHLPIGQLRQETLHFNLGKILKPILSHTSLAQAFQNYLMSNESEKKDKYKPFKNLLEQSIADELVQICTPPMLRAMQKEHLDKRLPSQMSPDILKELQRLFDKFCQEVNSADTSSLFLKALPSLLSDALMKYSLKDYVLSLQSEIDSQDMVSGKKVVGGCGLQLTLQAVLPSARGQAILQNEGVNIQQIAPESWIKIKKQTGSNEEGAVFRLMFEDVPFWATGNYQWMESTLFSASKEDEKTIDDMQKIMEALLSKNIASYQDFLAKTPNILRMRDRYQRSLLHLSATTEDISFTRHLLVEGLSTQQGDAQGYIPLHYAAMKGQLHQMELLIAQAVHTIHTRSHNGATPLIVAIQNRQLAAVKLLIEKKARAHISLITGYTALHCALHQSNEEIVMELLTASQEAHSTINTCTEEGVSPLMMACEINSDKLVAYLLKHGANPKLKRRDGLTAFDIAIQQESLSICKALALTSDFSNHTIELAVKEGSTDILKLLLRKENFLQYRNLAQETALMIAIQHDNIGAAILILEAINKIEDLNAKNCMGESALDLVIKGKFFTLLEAFLHKEINQKKAMTIDPMDLLKRLCKSGYSYFLRDYLTKQTHLNKAHYQELLQIAAEAGHYSVITLLLLPKGANLDKVQGHNGWKIEHYLAKFDDVFLFKKIARKKDLIRNDYKIEGKTLAYIAAENGSWLVLRFILEKMKRLSLSLQDHFNKRHLLYGIIERGEIEGVKLVFSLIEDLDLAHLSIAEGEMRAVHLAAKMGSKAILNFLLEKGADLDVEDHAGYTPLFYAVRCGSLSAISFLLKHQVSVTSAALYAAASRSNKAILALLLESTVDSNICCKQSRDTALLKAIKERDSDAFSHLLASGASLECQNQEGWTPLLLASATGQADILQMIINQVSIREGSFVNGNNALHLACKGKHPDCIEILLQAGFRKTYPNDKNLFPQQLVEGHQQSLAALGEGQKKINAFLMEIKEAVFSKDLEKVKHLMITFPVSEKISIYKNGYAFTGTLFHLVLNCWDVKDQIAEILEIFSSCSGMDLDLCDNQGNSYAHLLIKAGFNPNVIPHLKLDQVNFQGQTILHVAAEISDDQLFESIISAIPPAFVNTPDCQGRTPIFYAIQAKKQKNVECLLKKGADGHHHTMELITPLIYACILDQPLIVKILIENGIDINQRGMVDMVTPLYLALSLEKLELSLYLLFNGSSCNIVSSNGDHLSHIAAKTGKTSFLRLLSNQGFSLEMPNALGLKPIHLASASGQIKVLSLFKSMDISLDTPVISPKKEESLLQKDKKSKNLEKLTPLLVAAEYGQLDTVKWLVSHHANVEAISDKKLGVLAHAAKSMNKGILEFFQEYSLSYETKQIFPAIIQAILQDNLFHLSFLYRHLSIRIELMKGWNGLHFASYCGGFQSTQFFLNLGANPTQSSSSGENALELAAANQSVEQFHLLLKNCDLKLHLNKCNERQETLLHIATRAGNTLHVMLLMSYGASLDQGDALGRTALHIAAQEGHQEIALLLLACGADFSKKTVFSEKVPLEMVTIGNTQLIESMKRYETLRKSVKKDETLLHLAVKACNIKAVMVLLRDEEVDTERQDEKGATALHEAVRVKSLPMIRLLLRKGAGLNIQDKAGQTPLWIACIELRHSALTKFLVKSGADPKIKNAKGISLADQLNALDFPEKDELLRALN